MNERSARGDEASPATASTGAGPRYTLGEEIARGGMGRVVDATDTLLGRVVALKEVLSEDTEARRRFAREIRITARLEHPSIVPVHDAGTTPEGSPFYVMRKVTGRPLEDLVVEAETLAERLALLPHVLATAQAIAHAHERGVLHRDLKPSNILVGSLGETVVIDWGLAKVIDEPDEPDEPGLAATPSAGDSLQTRVGTVFGTPGFMAPEQIRGEVVGVKSDVYALGATLYYVLARRPPHAANSGDDMMTCALAGPPQAIGELAPGIPPALATIVDTALAYDDRVRYPTAAAFVADLQRFLTGQLVASHRYSRRERLQRFLRRYRLPVTIGALAVISIAVVATLAIRRVITEKNRADAALADALDRNEQLIVTQAQTLLVANPTAAVATAKAIGPERWREARSIGMAARAMGVARGYPASPFTSMIALTADGNHAISAGVDGVVREHDLVRHTTREILRLAPGLSAILVDADRRLVTWDREHVEVVDLATKAHRALVVPGAGIVDLHVRDTTVWVALDDGAVFAQQLEDAAFRRVPIDDEVRVISASPTNPWVAYGGTALWLQHGDDPPIKLTEGLVSLLDWADDGSRVVASVQMRTVEVTVAGDRPTITQDHSGDLAISLAAVRDGVFVGHVGTVVKTTVTRPSGFEIPVNEGAVIHLLHGYRGSVLAISGLGPINVLGDQVTFTIFPPALSLTVVTATNESRFVVGGTPGRLLVWDLAPMIPDELPLERPIGYALIGEHQLVAQYFDKPAEWHDLDKHDVTQLDVGPMPLNIFSAETGDLMALVSPESALVYRRGVQEPLRLVTQIRIGYFTGANELLIATTRGSIELLAPPAYTPQTLFVHEGEATSLSSYSNGDWVTATYTDGTLWRYNLGTRAGNSLTMHVPIGWSFVVPGGDVFFAQGAQLERWRGDGSVERHAVLPREIRSAHLLDDDHVLVLTEDNAGYDVRLSARDIVTSRFSPGTRVDSVALTSDLAITLDNAGSMFATDPITGVRWMLGRSSRAPFSIPTITREGTRVYVLAQRGILAWHQEVPKTPEDTRAFLDGLTNARAPTGAAALSWD